MKVKRQDFYWKETLIKHISERKWDDKNNNLQKNKTKAIESIEKYFTDFKTKPDWPTHIWKIPLLY